MKFFNPTSDLKELLLLQHIEKNPDTTQKEIACVIDAAPSMVNVYLDGLEEKGYLIRNYQSSKMVYYIITGEGIKRKNYLSITYLHELLKLYRLAEQNIEKFLLELEDRGYRDILFYGAGEVAETILRIVKGRGNRDLHVIALIDDDSTKDDKELSGYNIIPREAIKDYEHDGIVITSYTYEDEIIKRLEEIGYPMDKVNRFFSEQ